VRAELRCITDAGVFTLFDPGAVLHLINTPYDRWFDRLDDEARAGKLIAYSYGGDGDMLFRVFVDEPVPAELEARGTGRVEGVLEVPTGRLFAAGMEYLQHDGRVDVAAAQFQPKHGEGMTLPAGRYAVTAFDLDSEGVDDARAAAAEAASAGGARANRRFGAVAGCLGLVTLIGGGVALALIAADSSGEAWAFFKPWILGVAAAWAVLITARRRWPGTRAASAAADQVEEALAGAAVHLRRLGEGEAPPVARGCVFGDGYAPAPAKTSA